MPAEPRQLKRSTRPRLRQGFSGVRPVPYSNENMMRYEVQAGARPTNNYPHAVLL